MHRPALGPASLLLVLPTALVLACSGGRDAPAPEVETWTLDGPTLRIGTWDGGPDALTSVADLVAGPSGELFVLLPQEHRVKVFDSAGGFVRSIGREGEGPGELQRPVALGFVEDTLWVQDAGPRKLVLYSPTGELLGDRPYPVVETPDERVSVAFAQPLPGGGSVFVTSPPVRSELAGTDHPFPVLVRPAGGGAPDTVAYRNLAHGSRAMLTNRSGGEIVSMVVITQVFSDRTLWAPLADGTGLVLADRPVPVEAASAAFRLTRVTSTGDTTFSVEMPYEPVPVPEAHVDSVLETMSGGPMSEAELREVLYFPETYPPVSRLVAGTDGTVWVAREERPGRPLLWEVYAPDGSPLARLRTPPGLTVHQADRTQLRGTVTDELDVPYVVRYAVGAPGETATSEADGGG